MKSMSRKFGGLTSNKTADEADVSSILNEFKAADEMLDTVRTLSQSAMRYVADLLKLLNDLNAFRNAWNQILNMQTEMAGTFCTLYEQIDTEENTQRQHVPAETPQKYMQKCQSLRVAYTEEQTDLSQEITLLTTNLVKRAEDAKLHSKPLKRTIKHRENMKADYERYLTKAEKGRSRELRNQKEEMALAKHESELAQARINYQTADDHVKENFPGVTEAIYALLPYLRTTMIMLQTTLVGQLYTVLNEYTIQQSLPNPPPSDQEIVSVWDKEFTFMRKELETGLNVIAHGKATHMPMTVPDKAPTSSGLGIRAKFGGRKPAAEPPTTGRTSLGADLPRPGLARKSSSIHPDEEVAPMKPPRPAASPNLAPTPSWKTRSPSNGSVASFGAPPPYEAKPTALMPDWQQRRSSQLDQQAAAGARQPSPMLSSASNRGSDYFDSRRASGASSIASAAVAAVAAKKKPPPPVPVKRIASSSAQYVTAMFDFEAQSHGDLGFKEGDRIKVVKKTGSTDDWWEGELNGRTGSFPANYVQL